MIFRGNLNDIHTVSTLHPHGIHGISTRCPVAGGRNFTSENAPGGDPEHSHCVKGELFILHASSLYNSIRHLSTRKTIFL